jgi:Spy/CpxP family protein refolding chaperone
MRSKSVRRFLIGAAMAALVVAPVAAQPGHPPGGHGMMGRMAQELSLTMEQKTKIREIEAKYMDGTLGTLMDAAQQAREKLEALIHDATATNAQVQEAAIALAGQESLAAVERHHMATEIDAVLTAEQREKAAAIRAGMKERHGGPPPEASF